MEPPSDSDLEQEHAALLAEQPALKRKLRALEDARRAELERLAQAGPDQQATDLEGATQVKRPLGPV
jgi:hypothetical protein